MLRFAGVDVGAFKKGFHACIVEGRSLVAGPERIATPAETADWIRPFSPTVIAIDSPRSTALPGFTRRDAEAQFSAAKICGIRWTPERAKLACNSYYDWISNGLDLHGVLEHFGAEVIEVFPTASWTRWSGPRGSKTRARWTRQALTELELNRLPTRRLNQDDRDAIACALTAQQFRMGGTEAFGEIVVPRLPGS